MAPRPKPVPDHAGDDDRDCFARIRAGDAVAFEALFRRYVDRLCTFAFVYTQTRDSAEEIVQDLFLWLWTHRSAIEPPRSVPGYLHAAVRNRALNRVRDRATELRFYETETERGTEHLAPGGFDAPDALAEANDLQVALDHAVAAMPLRCREVFTLARTQSLTYTEISVVLTLSPKTVEIHMSRALAFLRERLAPWLAG
jgi:RNA polymerase sigma-70 factor, ECF subfamily